VSHPGEREGRSPLGPEFDLIDRLAAILPRGEELPPEARESLVLGVGDDAAVWRLPSGDAAILTVDTVVEGVHAWPSEPAADVGARALTAAVSDVVAMGGIPQLALVALQAPAEVPDKRLLQLYEGVAREAGVLDVAVVGGDLVDTPGPLALSITVYGVCKESSLWPRSGAQEGDLVAITGYLGGVRGGLEIYNSMAKGQLDKEWARNLASRKSNPRARVSAARILQNASGVHACIDISDGLSSDAWHIALASGVRMALERRAIPIHPDVAAYLAWHAEEDDAAPRDPVAFAMDSGEEYELLVTLDPAHPAVQEEWIGSKGIFAEQAGVPLSLVGRVEPGPPAVVLVDGDEKRAIEPGGFSHMRPDGGRA
jgi:thiamine-monophosphate kinase